MAAPAFEAAGAAVVDILASADIAAPEGTAAGKLVLVTMFLDGDALTVTPAAGFTAAEGIPSQITGVSGSHSLYVWWKRLTGADLGPYTFSWGTDRYVETFSTLYNNVVASGTPFDSPTDTAQDTANDTVTPAVDVTSLGPDRLLVWGGTNWAGGAWTQPTSFASRYNTAGVVSLADRSWPTAGNSGPVTGTCTGSDKRTAWLGAMIGTTGGAAAAASPPSRRPGMGALLQL
ncbi:hypothetical protein [Nonomuraea sp. SYSU D8015]|uniref:hypothetical protein n=1 Tax=Nonomuraea sp. SYSU D8015 TaxID=2593644 RepID=UPI0016607B5E|nr:hypothetical protein [Nonomuraea sp. SYSU D8015]